MEKGAKIFIKKAGLLLKNVEFVNEPILTKEKYDQFYEPSGGSISGGGYCIFYKKTNVNSGTIHVLPINVEDEIFKIEI